MDPLIRVGEKAPDFHLPDIDGKEYSLAGFQGCIVILVFWSAECGWCERVDRELLAYHEEWGEKVKILWVASNATEGHDFISRVSRERDISPVLADDRQALADAYGARTTPHIFIVDSYGRLAYQGAWSDITLRQRIATKVYVKMAIEALLEGRQPSVSQTPAFGCVLVRNSA